MSRRWLAAVAVLSIASVIAVRADAQTSVEAASEGISTSCRDDGLDFSGQLRLSLPPGATVRHSYRVHDAATNVALGADDTPVPSAVATTIPFSDPQFFGGAWTAGLPFTYEQTTQVLTADGSGAASVAATQIVAVSCTVAGAPGVVTITDSTPSAPTTAPSGPTTTPANAIVAVPRFTG